MTYSDAMAEIEQILDRFRRDRMSVDELTAQVQRATELITHCRTRLMKTEEELQRIDTETSE